MAKRKLQIPDYIFESGWEVCNKVGGIYTVMATKAKTLHEKFGDNLIFIGPDLWTETENPDFKENKTLMSGWKKAAKAEGLNVRVGRWNIACRPIVVLVDYRPLFAQKNEIYRQMWEAYGVDSLQAAGDYDDCCMFAVAAAKTIVSVYKYLKLENKRVVAQFHEWSLGMAALYLKQQLPAVRTVFTTHATTVGRSICFNNKPLYSQFENYDGDTMARELNVSAKHSLEKRAAHNADVFTTVSRITARECAQLLDKQPDVITPNGFEPDIVPDEKTFESQRKKARKALIDFASAATGTKIDSKALLVATSGRYEYRNKGIDLFIEALNRVKLSEPKRQIVSFILVPSVDCDGKVGEYLRWLNFNNSPEYGTKIVLIPHYLNCSDGVFNLPYYSLLTAFDLTVFPSYYEPWGYTPLESAAFGIPTITTSLAGFGRWAKDSGVSGEKLLEGIEVVDRTDENYSDAAQKVCDSIIACSLWTKKQIEEASTAARKIASKAEWKEFIKYYEEAYGF